LGEIKRDDAVSTLGNRHAVAAFVSSPPPCCCYDYEEESHGIPPSAPSAVLEILNI